MLKTCSECNRLFKGEGTKCSKCSSMPEDVNSLEACCKCGVVSGNLISGYCMKCAVREESVDNFKVVRNYLYANPGLDIRTLSNATMVSMIEINSYIVAGKLDVLEGVNTITSGKCEECGAEISTGSICMSCKRNRVQIERIKSQINQKISNGLNSKEIGFRSR